MYSVITLPLAEDDIQNNTDYIAFEKGAPETALKLSVGFRNKLPNWNLCQTSMSWMKMMNWRHWEFVNAKPLLLKMNF